jgi:hypothetical protein
MKKRFSWRDGLLLVAALTLFTACEVKSHVEGWMPSVEAQMVTEENHSVTACRLQVWPAEPDKEVGLSDVFSGSETAIVQIGSGNTQAYIPQRDEEGRCPKIAWIVLNTSAERVGYGRCEELESGFEFITKVSCERE